ncbi:MAG: response regulator [Deltaproteobacteria bacterium]|nr:response regulator [Deltaproteobacteria bacterium]
MVLVEDDDDLRTALVAAIERDGIEVCAVRDGTSAVKAVLSHQPDVVLLDLIIGSKGDDASSVVSRIRSDPRGKGVAIVLVSGVSNLEQHASRLGAEAILPKPFGLRDLYETIRPFCRRLASGSVAPVDRSGIAGSSAPPV